jgi:hypothetical protein
VPFVSYTMSYRLYRDASGAWKFKTRKTGPGGPFESDETV